jgi:hypothetical protein
MLRVLEDRSLLRMHRSKALLQVQNAMHYLGEVEGPEEERSRWGDAGIGRPVSFGLRIAEYGMRSESIGFEFLSLEL